MKKENNKEYHLHIHINDQISGNWKCYRRLLFLKQNKISTLVQFSSLAHTVLAYWQVATQAESTGNERLRQRFMRRYHCIDRWGKPRQVRVN